MKAGCMEKWKKQMWERANLIERCLEISVCCKINSSLVIRSSPALTPTSPGHWQDTATPSAYTGKAQHRLPRTHLISLALPLTSISIPLIALRCLLPHFPHAALHPSPSSLIMLSYPSFLCAFLYLSCSAVCTLSLSSPTLSNFFFVPPILSSFLSLLSVYFSYLLSFVFSVFRPLHTMCEQWSCRFIACHTVQDGSNKILSSWRNLCQTVRCLFWGMSEYALNVWWIGAVWFRHVICHPSLAIELAQFLT